MFLGNFLAKKGVSPFPKDRPYWYPPLQQSVYSLFRLFHQISWEGSEFIPKNTRGILVSNHPTYYDPILIHLASPRLIHFFAWDALFRSPCLAKLIQPFGAIPVNLDEKGSSTVNLAAFRKGLRILEKDGLLGIFPEGGRTPQKEGYLLYPFRFGAFQLAYLTGAPLIPVVITGAHEVWPSHKKYPRLGKIHLRFLPPIPVPKKRYGQIGPDEIEDLRDKVYQLILRQLQSIYTQPGIRNIGRY